jgi:LemA protein
VPRLVEVVKAYSKHESELRRLLAEMRRDLVFYPICEEKKTQLIGVIEHYPKLKANENFLSLMQTLENIEENIAHTREFYNRSVLTYDNMVEQFPSNIIARISKMRRAKFLDRYELE